MSLTSEERAFRVFRSQKSQNESFPNFRNFAQSNLAPKNASSLEVAQIVGGQNVQSMRVKRSDPQKDRHFPDLFFQGFLSSGWF